jgi:hypothetical protein
MLPNLSAENAGALLATSTLITLSVFGSAGLDAKDNGVKVRFAIEDLLDLFALQQGISSILSSAASHVLEGPFAPILNDPIEPLPAQPILQQLYEKIPEITSFIWSHSSLSPERRQEVLENLTRLQEVLQFAMAPFSDNRELRFLFLWPIRISPNFFAMLKAKDSVALVLLAYYAVALRAAEPLYWFMDGWAERVIRAIAETIDSSWQAIVQWPWDFILGAQTQAQHQSESQQHDLAFDNNNQ